MHEIIRNIHFIYQAKQRQTLRQLPVTSPLFIWIRNGQKRVITENSNYICHAKQCIIFPAPAQFGIENIPEPQGIYFAHCIMAPKIWMARFRQRYSDLIPHNGNSAPVFDLSPSLQRQLEEFINLTELSDPTPLALARVEMAWQQILLTMIHDGVGGGLLTHPKENLADTVRALIQTDLTHEWQGQALANRLNMSESTFRRKLQSENVSFIQLLHQLRMSHAAHLLMSSSKNIQQIALDTGYSSPSKFASRFKKQFGLTPSALRKTL